MNNFIYEQINSRKTKYLEHDLRDQVTQNHRSHSNQACAANEDTNKSV